MRERKDLPAGLKVLPFLVALIFSGSFPALGSQQDSVQYVRGRRVSLPETEQGPFPMDFGYPIDPGEFCGGYWEEDTGIALIVTKASEESFNSFGETWAYEVSFYEADWDNILLGRVRLYQEDNYGIALDDCDSSPNLKWNEEEGLFEIGNNIYAPSDETARPLHGVYRKVLELMPLGTVEEIGIALELGIPAGMTVSVKEEIDFDNEAKMFTDEIEFLKKGDVLAAASVSLDTLEIRDRVPYER